jgi:sugar O-acyltransferase (sialic acid O-acetyltransferase NeuD family)
MIIVGAGAAGIETAGFFLNQPDKEEIIFYDKNVIEKKIWNKFLVVNDLETIKQILKNNPKFCVTIGNPRKREKMFNLMIKLGAVPTNIIVSKTISSEISENATIIQPGVCISFDVIIKNSCFIHANSVIGHKVEIGNFVNISPLCSIIGPCKIGDFSYIGAKSVIMPNINIGKNTYITPGSVVNRDIKDYETF